MRESCLLLAAVLACLAIPAQAEVPAQAIVYVGTSLPVRTGGPTVSIAAYGWSTARTSSLSLYAGPCWAFLGDRLEVEVKVGAYVDSGAVPVLNLELTWEDGPLQLDWFTDVFWPAGAYTWLAGRWGFGPLYAGALADATLQRRGDDEFAAGPMFGVGSKALALGVAPMWSSESDFTLRFLIDLTIP